MSIAVGETIPDVKVMTDRGGARSTSRPEKVLGSGKVVLFAVPGAFTPTCSDYHLPSFVIRQDELKAKGGDTVACISVNDPFVMSAWGEFAELGGPVVPAGRRQRRVHLRRRTRDGRERIRPRHPLAAVRHGAGGRRGDGVVRGARPRASRSVQGSRTRNKNLFLEAEIPLLPSWNSPRPCAQRAASTSSPAKPVDDAKSPPAPRHGSVRTERWEPAGPAT